MTSNQKQKLFYENDSYSQYLWVKGRHSSSRKKEKRSRESRTKTSIKYDINNKGKMKYPTIFINEEVKDAYMKDQFGSHMYGDESGINIKCKDRESVIKFFTLVKKLKRKGVKYYIPGIIHRPFRGIYRRTFMGSWDFDKKSCKKDYTKWRKLTRMDRTDTVMEGRETYLARKKFLKKQRLRHLAREEGIFKRHHLYHDDDVCGICLSSMNGEEVTITSCRHVFCGRCFHRLQGYTLGKNPYNGVVICPMCREYLANPLMMPF